MPTTFPPSFGVVSRPDCVHRSPRVRHCGIRRLARGRQSWLLYCVHDRHRQWLHDGRSGGRLRRRDDVGSGEATAQSRERCDTERHCRAWHTTKASVALVATLGARFVDRLAFLAELQVQRRAAALAERGVGRIQVVAGKALLWHGHYKNYRKSLTERGASYLLPSTSVPCHLSWEGPSEP